MSVDKITSCLSILLQASQAATEFQHTQPNWVCSIALRIYLFKTAIDLSLLVQMLISSERTHGCSPEPTWRARAENEMKV